MSLPRSTFATIFVLFLLTACGGGGGPQPTATEPATRTPTPAASPTPVDTATSVAPEATATPPPPPTAPPSGSAQVIRRGDPASNAVVLTFDAGADAGFTAQTLETLGVNGITAAFGVTGRWAEQNPDLLRRIVQDGHELINHSYDHASFTGLSTGLPALTQARRWDQLDAAEEIVRTITGASTKPYFRPPFGDYDESVNADVFARGYRYTVMWTVDSMGWNGLPADAIVERCLAQAVAGAVFVFHVGSASQDAAALQRVIDGLRAAGYGFVPLSAFAPR